MDLFKYYDLKFISLITVDEIESNIHINVDTSLFV